MTHSTESTARGVETYRVRVQKDSLIFSAAHFITFGDNFCERIHGHNYKVWAEIRGELDPNHYVIDFIYLLKVLQSITQPFDHHVLLPDRHPTISVHVSDTEVETRFEDRRWIFPREDCVILPIANTTAELLARHIGEQLLARLETDQLPPPLGLQIGVDENHGQWAVYEWQPAKGSTGSPA